MCVLEEAAAPVLKLELCGPSLAVGLLGDESLQVWDKMGGECIYSVSLVSFDLLPRSLPPFLSPSLPSCLPASLLWCNSTRNSIRLNIIRSSLLNHQ